MEKITVYWVAREYGYKTDVESLEFSTKANADKFIALMKSEGYKITKFGRDGYTGE